jgi:hypothetical protein
MYAVGSPRSNCNTSDYKAYYQFDVSGLPATVDSVFFGVMHAPHTNYCYSNCNADFYFYFVTSTWDEMTLAQQNEPTEDTAAFYGPIAISFPNDYQIQEYDITTAYTAWKSGNTPNNGFVVYSPTVGCNNAAVTFNTHTSDDTDSTNRPYLRIYYPSQAGLDENELQLTVYPNPFEDYIQVNLTAMDNYYLADLTGRKIAIDYDAGNQRIHTSNLAKGIYLLYVERNGAHTVKKLIKR